MTRYDLKTFDCVVRLQRLYEPLKFQVKAYTVEQAADEVRFKHRLRGKDPHKGFEIREA